MKNIIEVKGVWEIPVKRFYLPIKIAGNCPVCGRLGVTDLESDYLSNPMINDAETVSINCEHCDDWFEKEITLKISIETEE